MFWGIYIIKTFNYLYILHLPSNFPPTLNIVGNKYGETYQISKSSICILSLSFFIWGKKTKREELGWYGRSRIYLYSKQFLNSYRESQWFSGGHCTKCYYIPKSQPPHHHHLTLLNMAKKGQRPLSAVVTRPHVYSGLQSTEK